MIVDDDESIRQAVGRMLDAAGFRAELFVSGASLLETQASRAGPQGAAQVGLERGRYLLWQ